jgi:HAD superfamily hydrolase (TIGR01450 family)
MIVYRKRRQQQQQKKILYPQNRFSIASTCSVAFILCLALTSTTAYTVAAPKLGRTATSSRLLSSPTLRHSSSSVTSTKGGRSSSSGDRWSIGSGMREIRGIRELADAYDVYVLDLWGVLHDGTRAYDGVHDAVRQLRARGKTLVLLSNSSKRVGHVQKLLIRLGFDPHDFAAIVTSGDAAYQLLCGADGEGFAKTLAWPSLLDATNVDQRKVFVLGSGDEDVEYCESCGWTVTALEEANLIVARGTFTIHNGGGGVDGTGEVVHKRDDTQRYEKRLAEVLEQAAARRLPMLVTNPDKVRPDAERPPMPGAIGDAYERILALTAAVPTVKDETVEHQRLVKRVGKPFPDVYDLALREFTTTKGIAKDRICMIGDALETDVTGGVRYGIDTVWVLKDGIHAPELEEYDTLEQGASAVLVAFNDKSNTGTYAQGLKLQPTCFVAHFRW